MYFHAEANKRKKDAAAADTTKAAAKKTDTTKAAAKKQVYHGTCACLHAIRHCHVTHICLACHCQFFADGVCIHAHASTCDTQAGHARSQVAKSVPATEGKKKKSAAKADTGPKVKGAKSAYIFFSNDKRAELKGVSLFRCGTLALTMHAFP